MRSRTQLRRSRAAFWLLAAIFAADCCANELSSELRIWTEQGAGRQAHAVLLQADNETARFRTTSGREATIPRAALCAEDQQFIERALAGQHSPPATQAADSGPFNLLLSYLEPLDSQTGKQVRQVAAQMPKSTGPLPPNMAYVRLSKQFLSQYFPRQTNRQFQVSEKIVGTAVRGQSHLRGQMELTLVPNANQAHAVLRFLGTTTSDTTGYSGPVQVFSHSVTQFQAEKQIWFDGHVIQTRPTSTKAVTRATNTGVASSLPGIRGRISQRIGVQRERALHSQAEWEGAQAAARRINVEMDKVAQGKLNLMKQYAEQLRGQIPAEHPLAPRRLHCVTTADSLLVAVLGAESEIAFVTPPQLLASRPDAEVYLHATLVSRALASQEIRQTMLPLLGLLYLTDDASPSSGEKAASPPARCQMSWSSDQQWLGVTWELDSSRALAKSPTKSEARIPKSERNPKLR